MRLRDCTRQDSDRRPRALRRAATAARSRPAADRLPDDDFPAWLVDAVHAGVCVGIGVLGLLGPLRETRSWPAALAACGYALALVLVHLAWFRHGHGRFRGLSLVLQAALGLVPVLHLGVTWSALSCFFLGSVLLVAKPLVSVPLLVLVPGGVGVLSAGVGTAHVSVAEGLHAVAFTAAAAVAVFGLSWFALLAAEREISRRELTARVVAEERLRFAQDTHDLLGLSLSAITLKVELVRRLVETRPEQAQHELTELVTMSRKALADVRSVAAGKRELCLADEVRAAAAVLETAGVGVCPGQKLPEHLPEPVATTFATILRESATNVVRHSKATWCEVTVGGDEGRSVATRRERRCGARGNRGRRRGTRCGAAEPGEPREPPRRRAHGRGAARRPVRPACFGAAGAVRAAPAGSPGFGAAQSHSASVAIRIAWTRLRALSFVTEAAR